MNVAIPLFPSKNKLTSRRAESHAISSILLIAIAVTAGVVLFTIAQGSNVHLEISNSPQIDSLEITGFDARDTSLLILHDGAMADNSASPGDFDGQAGNGLLRGERIAIYVKNNSISDVYFNEVRFAGTELVFAPVVPLTAYNASLMNPGEFVIATKGATGVANLSSSAKLKAGQEATFLIELDSTIPVQRDTSFKMVTTNGAGFVGTIYLGHQTGGF